VERVHRALPPERGATPGLFEEVARCDPLGALPEGSLRDLVDRAVVRGIERGRVLLLEGSPRPGDPDPVLYVVLSGWCRVVRHSADGRETVLDVRGPGDLIGEEAVVLRRSARPPPSPGVIASTSCRVAAMPGAVALETIMSADRSREALLRHLALRAMSAQRRLADRALPVQERLVGLLLRVAGPREPAGTGNGSYAAPRAWRRVPPLAQHDLALLIGASRETVNRALAALAASGQVMLLRGQPVAVSGPSLVDREEVE
jgi:CRP/FNR family transcriptional regulator, cyclic AMP receptor protein